MNEELLTQNEKNIIHIALSKLYFQLIKNDELMGDSNPELKKCWEEDKGTVKSIFIKLLEQPLEITDEAGNIV